MQEIHYKRLLNVAKALRESPNPDKFYMGTYGYDCGTPACALGHYAARHDLQRAFKLSKTGFFTHSRRSRPLRQLGYGLMYDSEPVLNHFGISCADAFTLFSSVGCGNAETAKQAARFIERFVAEKRRADKARK